MRASIGIPIELKDNTQKTKMGIYFLWFGSKYYIGSTKNLNKRRQLHEWVLNKFIDSVEVGSASIYNILHLLFTDLSIERGIMELVHEVEGEDELLSAEQSYLNDSSEDEYCLNKSFVAVRYDEKHKDIIVERLKDSIPDQINECVFKLFYKEKYVIVKGKSLIGSIKCVSRAVEAFSKKERDKWPIDHLYLHFIELILSENDPDPQYSIEMLLVSANAFDLLKCEQMELWDSQKDPDCLNNCVDAYIPVYREDTGKYGWINTGEMLNFLKWKKKKMQDPELASRVTSTQTDILDHLEE